MGVNVRTDLQFEYVSESISKPRLRKICEQRMENVMVMSTRMAPVNAIRFGVEPYNRALNYALYSQMPMLHRGATRDDFVQMCSNSYPSEDPDDIMDFVGIHNYEHIMTMLDFWVNAPVTFESALDEYGKVAFAKEREIRFFAERLKTAPLSGLVTQARRVSGKYRDCGYLSIYLLAIDIVMGVYG